MEKKYICYGDYIFSKSDSDRHYISAKRVAELYKVNPQECFFVEIHKDKPGLDRRNNLIRLFPKYNGDYTLT